MHLDMLSDQSTPTGDALQIDEHLVSLVYPASLAAEQYRSVRHTIEQHHRRAGHAVFGVSSPSAVDGKTTTAINLAGALAQSPEARVLLIEADLRRPTIAERLGLGHRPGLGLVQAIETPHLTIEDVARRLPAHNLSVVTAGGCPDAPYEILKSPRLGELFEQARQCFDYVLLDTPPIVSVPDCRIIGTCVDGWLVVVAAHRTSRKLLEEALDVLEPQKTLGFIFANDDRFRSGGRYYGGYYGAESARGGAVLGRSGRGR